MRFRRGGTAIAETSKFDKLHCQLILEQPQVLSDPAAVPNSLSLALNFGMRGEKSRQAYLRL